MKAVGYITVFCLVLFGAHYIATNAAGYNVELALFFGALIPIVMAFIADMAGDM